MLEKLGIRFAMNLIVMWYIIQMNAVSVYMNLTVFIYIIGYAILIALIIESLYGIFRRWIDYTYMMIGVMVFISCLFFKIVGSGIYFGILVYIFISLGIDFYREYKMTKLLEKAFHFHLKEK
ncbi:MAG: hypothetical protein ACLUVC_12420 [Longibaculum sp.]